MKISAIDVLAFAGIFLIGCASYFFDARLLLVYTGLLFLWLARVLAKIEKPVEGKKN